MSEKISIQEITLPITSEGTSEPENVTYKFAQIDDTLSVAGKAADAKATGDALEALNNNKVDAVSGKGLSTEDYTTEEKTKLYGIETGAEANVNPDWNATSGDAEIKNKPTTLAGYGITDAYTKTEVDAQQAEVDGEIIDLKGALTSKAEQDGAYPDLTAGQMLSKNEASDSVPYNFRAVGHDATLEYTDAIVGGSVVRNQLYNKTYPQSTTSNGVQFTVNEDGSITANGTATSDTYYAVTNQMSFGNHVVYVGGCPAGGAIQKYRLYMDSNPINDFGDGGINKQNVDNMRFYINIKSGITMTNHVFKPQIIDLTQALGTTIADYIYTLETATVGSGVAWLKKHFPKLFTYQEYNAGEIVSVQGLSQHVTVGFNQWDEEWEVGTINTSNGTKETSSTRIRSKNYIPVLSGSTYAITVGNGAYATSMRACFYDSNFNFISGNADFPSASTLGLYPSTFTVPSNADYMLFSPYTDYGTTYNHDICINLSDPAKNGTYEPYVKHTYPLDDSLTLRGIPKLDANNKLYYDGDTYKPSGEVNRRYYAIDLGSLSFYKANVTGSHYRFVSFNVPSPMPKYYSDASTLANIICTKYLAISAGESWIGEKTGISINTNGGVLINDESFADASSLESSLSGVYLVYELATPITETADPFQTPQICDKSGTEEYVTTGIVPVGHLTKYPEDLRAKIEGLPWNLSMVAPIENGTTASQAYTTGQYFLHNDLFCKALTSIASGATFTLNTNYSVTTVAAELFAALNS